MEFYNRVEGSAQLSIQQGQVEIYSQGAEWESVDRKFLRDRIILC